MTTAKPLARIIPLPGAAIEPVRQHPRRGRFPAIVTHIRYGRFYKLQAKKGDKLKNEVEECRKFLETCEGIYNHARYELLLAQQRAGMKVKL